MIEENLYSVLGLAYDCKHCVRHGFRKQSARKGLSSAQNAGKQQEDWKNTNRHWNNLWIWWGSVEVRRLNQSRPTAVLPSSARQDWLTEPILIKSVVPNWFRRRSSHELNSWNLIRLGWSTASELGLGDEYTTIPSAPTEVSKRPPKNLLLWIIYIQRLA